MSKFRVTYFSLLLLGLLACAKRPWQEFNDASVRALAAHFPSPPVEYSMTFYWGWDGEITEGVIARDLDAFKERGVHIVTLESGYDMGSPYLSPGWFELVKKTVQLARQRDMRVWIVDEGKYPSGFAGGKFTTDAPELRMQALVVAEQMELTGGDTLSHKVSSDVVSAIAVNLLDSTNQILTLEAGELRWRAPQGQWQVLIVKHDFRSSPTRAVNNPTRGKDASHSLCDYLNPAATRRFIEFTHEQHKKVVGDEFGRTVLGFRGDEPDFSIRGIPWTPQLFATFEKVKGYDVRPHVAAFFAPQLTNEQQRMKADYWDVWSDLFGENFFKVQADWCARHNLEYLVHLNHEDKMMQLVRSEGDFFECMRHAQMPGVDAIWDQILPGKVADYPKYASSAAHLYGKPRAFTESFAAYRPVPDVAQAKWILDHQLARGLNMVEVMFIPASTKGELGLNGWTAAPEFPAIATYIHRACYMLSQGRPVAEIAVYHPTASLWLGDRQANGHVLRLMQQLLEQQLDFDFIDDAALASTLVSANGALKNLSAQSYRAIIVPPTKVISRAALARLQSFAAAGGRVFFLGPEPAVADRTFLHAAGPADVGWAFREPSGELTAVQDILPRPDVKLDNACPSVKYAHRRLADADLYFFFNESTEEQIRQALLCGSGQVTEWDAMTGVIKAVDSASADEGRVRLQLELQPWGTKFIVVGAAPPRLE